MDQFVDIGNVYVISDLHGYRLSDFLNLLRRASFSKKDHLYVLGDAIDRNGNGGISLLRWMMKQENVTFLLGNHEASLIVLEDYIRKNILQTQGEPELFQRIRFAKETKKEPKLNEEETRFLFYCSDGGLATVKALHALYQKDPNQADEMFDFLHTAPVYKEISINHKTYILSHSGINHFDPERPLTDYAESDFLNCWPCLSDRFYNDKILIFGHTPTGSLDKTMRGHIIYTDTWIDIDVGAGWGEEPVLLRLNDLKEFR